MKCKSCWKSIVTRFILVEHINDTLNRWIFPSILDPRFLKKIIILWRNFFYFSNFYHYYYWSFLESKQSLLTGDRRLWFKTNFAISCTIGQVWRGEKISQDLGLCVATCGGSEINSTFYDNLAHLFDLLTAFLYDVSEYHQSFCPYRLFSGRKYYISWK